MPFKLIEKPKKADTTPAPVSTEKAGGSCGGKHCIKKGAKGKLIEEINIRLAGFGGTVPTDEFTNQTEKAVKQFQKDYMGVTPSGKICRDTLIAIDEFCDKFNINFDDVKCKCGKCTGFGNGKYEDQYMSSSILEKHRKYEYPGIHRSLVWALRAVMFYTNEKEKELGYTVKCIYSAYRCWIDNNQNKRDTTNHMGKAFDIHFKKNGVKTSALEDMNSIRKNIYEKYLGATYWKDPNTIGLESAAIGATAWVHFDVREYEMKYMDKKFFVQSIDKVDGDKMIDIAKKESFNTFNCTSISKQNGITSRTIEERQQTNYTIEDAKTALEHINNVYGKEMAIIVEKMYRGETGHFTSGQYRLTGTGGMEAAGKAPYYGWDKSFFEKFPEYKLLGLVEMYEGEGLSKEGGNAQITDKAKQFIIFPSVEAAMVFKAEYIKRHDGNYARWHSTKPEVQEVYRNSLKLIKARISENF